MAQNFRIDTVAGVDLLSVAARLLWYKEVPTAGHFGGYRDNSNPPYYGWKWVDGTPADNLNCGFAGCGIFVPDQPK